jgi:hypothetical protein
VLANLKHDAKDLETGTVGRIVLLDDLMGIDERFA